MILLDCIHTIIISAILICTQSNVYFDYNNLNNWLSDINLADSGRTYANHSE